MYDIGTGVPFDASKSITDTIRTTADMLMFDYRCRTGARYYSIQYSTGELFDSIRTVGKYLSLPHIFYSQYLAEINKTVRVVISFNSMLALQIELKLWDGDVEDTEWDLVNFVIVHRQSSQGDDSVETFLGKVYASTTNRVDVSALGELRIAITPIVNDGVTTSELNGLFSDAFNIRLMSTAINKADSSKRKQIVFETDCVRSFNILNGTTNNLLVNFNY